MPKSNTMVKGPSFTWFDRLSVQTGDLACVCSVCGQPITEQDEIVRVWEIADTGKLHEGRFHHGQGKNCFESYRRGY